MTLANNPDMTPDMTAVLKARARLAGRIQLTPIVESLNKNKNNITFLFEKYEI